MRSASPELVWENYLLLTRIEQACKELKGNLARRHASGLTARAILDKLESVAMIDVHLPATDGREIILSRYSEPQADVQLLLSRLGLKLPKQSPPKVFGTPSHPL